MAQRRTGRHYTQPHRQPRWAAPRRGKGATRRGKAPRRPGLDLSQHTDGAERGVDTWVGFKYGARYYDR